MSAGGWLALLGGGEFTFGETLEADRAWLEKTGAGTIGFLPAASGSLDYGRHFEGYLGEQFGRAVELVPVYRARDARRSRNAERVRACAAVYLGGGIADQLVETLADSPVLDELRHKVRSGGVVAAIGAAAQACGSVFRALRGGGVEAGLGLAAELAVEPNFDPGHDRRLRQLVGAPGAGRGIGLAAGSVLLVGPSGAFEAIGDVFALGAADADLVPLVGETAPGGERPPAPC